MAGGGGDGGGRKRSRLRRARSAGEARADTVSSPPRRRSERNVLSSSQSTFNQEKQCLAAAKMVGTPKPAPFKGRPITLKKIVPRNRQITESAVVPRRSPRNPSCKENKENLPARAAKVKSPDKDEGTAEFKLPSLPGSPNPQPGVLQAAAGVLSAVNTNVPESSLADERDWDMAKRVRRSYSRLEISLTQSFLEKEEPRCLGLLDASTPSHALSKRQTLFGFEKLLVPDGLGSVSPVNAGAPQKAVTAAAAGEPEAINEIDPDIPGISFAKEKRRKKKMPQFANSELDEWAAQMNAEFEEAEKFDLLVE